ncbi:alpha/beta fold hydrolase [Mycobacteroides abscessus]|uniref:alpha/beta fold hydrolase n=1 Tax=Mycobacteroides abscessus TaxID=36809 RepID=UPI000312AD0E|nr:alpha/beta fold hydrolase [Mycobacteroides abscessus]
MALTRIATAVPDRILRPTERRHTVTVRSCSGEIIALAVYEYGAEHADTVVLVHGWPDTHHVWRGVVALLASRFRVIAYDVRGHGQSTGCVRTADFSLAELSKDLLTVIDTLSPGRPVHLVAHDWGSATAWEAVTEPAGSQRIASFTSVSGPCLDHISIWARDRLAAPTVRNLRELAAQLASSAYMVFFMSPLLPRLVLRIAGNERRWGHLLRLMEGMPGQELSFAPTLRSDMISGLRLYRANIAQRLLRPRRRYTDVPVQLIVNTRDIALRPAIYDDIARWLNRFRRCDLPTGHWLPYAAPALIADIATNFIFEIIGNQETS